jgi:hypothetical protein
MPPQEFLKGANMFELIGPFVLIALIIGFAIGEYGVVSLALTGFALWLFGYIPDVLTFVQSHPKLTVLYVLSYFGIGFAWSVFKWAKQFLDLNREELKLIALKEDKAAYEVYLDYLKSDEYAWDDKRRSIYKNLTRLDLLSRANQVGTWILWWPLSIVKYILGDLLVDLGKLIVRLFKRVYTKAVEIAIKSLVR